MTPNTECPIGGISRRNTLEAGVESFREYMGRLGRTALDDGEVAEAFTRVFQLERLLSWLLQPRIVRRVFDETEGETSSPRESPAGVPPSLDDVWPLLEEHLTDPEGVTDWPGVPPDPRPADGEDRVESP